MACASHPACQLSLEPIEEQRGVTQIHQRGLVGWRSRPQQRQRNPHLSHHRVQLRLRIAAQFKVSQQSHGASVIGPRTVRGIWDAQGRADRRPHRGATGTRVKECSTPANTCGPKPLGSADWPTGCHVARHRHGDPGLLRLTMAWSCSMSRNLTCTRACCKNAVY